MKRKDLIKELEGNGCVLIRHGGKHDRYHNRVSIHPEEIVSGEFLEPLGITYVAFAAHLGVAVQRINELIRGKRGVATGPIDILAGARGP